MTRAARPTFGWQLRSETPGTRQTAYRLQVSGPDGAAVWDTGRVGSGQAAFVTYRGPALASRTRYTWTVTAWDNHGGTAAAASWFETALAPADWQATWMRTPRAYVQRQKGFGTQPPATLFRRSFTLDAAPAAARLYLTCLGVYRLTVNGQRPDDREFAPEHTSYRKTLCYQTYDVTGLLRAGENVLGIEVGDGWYCCPQTQPPIDGLQPDHTVLFQLEVTGADGRRRVVASDERLRCSEGEVRASDLFDGEAQDLRLATPGWDAPGFDAGAWAKPRAVAPPLPPEALCPEVGGPVRPVCTLPAVRVYRSPKNEWIVDFGQVVTGRARVTASLPAGAALTLEHFEATEPDGSYHNSVQSAMGVTEQKDVFISTVRSIPTRPSLPSTVFAMCASRDSIHHSPASSQRWCWPATRPMPGTLPARMRVSIGCTRTRDGASAVTRCPSRPTAPSVRRPAGLGTSHCMPVRCCLTRTPPAF